MTLKRIDFTGNLISEIEDGAFAKLTMLEELSLAENALVKLPMLPGKLISFNANHNKLKTKGVKANAFKVKSTKRNVCIKTVPQTVSCILNPDKLHFLQKLNKLIHVYLAHNELEAVPAIPESVRTLHLQVGLLQMLCMLNI